MVAVVPPFYENFDNTHCAQCALRSIMGYFEPEKEWTWEELDAFTGKEPDKWTWQYRGQINMAQRGYHVIAIHTEDIGEFLNFGIYETMVKTLGREAADMQRKMVDLDSVIEDLKTFRKLTDSGKIVHELRVPTVEDMRRLLGEGYLLDCALNSRKMYGREGYASHVVAVYGIDVDHVYFHESNKPGRPETKMPIEQFVAACCDPTPHQWAIAAYKKG